MKRVYDIIESNQLSTKIIRFISNNPLYKSVFVLGSGTILAQLIGILSMPIITRIYTPEDLGLLAAYTSILSIVAVTATFRYEFAYALPKRDDGAANLFALCLILLIATTAGFSLILLFGGDILVNILNLDPLADYVLLLILGFFGIGLYTTLNYWAIRQRDYKRITYTKINQSACSAVFKILLGFLSFGPIGLIIGHVVSEIAGIGTYSRAMWIKERDGLRRISFSGIKTVAKEYWSFPVLNLPASIVNNFTIYLPAIMLLAIYDGQTAGFYALANSMMVIPGSAISRSLAQAYLGEASKMVREESQDLRSLYVKTIRHLSFIAIPLIGTFALCAPFVVPVIFGEAWIEAGWYCLPLALHVIPNFIVYPTTKLEIYGFNHWKLIWDITRLVAVFVGFYIGQLYGVPVLIMLTIYALIMLSMNIILIKLNLKAISNITHMLSVKA
ncbi:oligosaccharide flippase family protein [Methanoculleus frigidifontis]|nr:oligosaccharide flippase family protein [Methanoculleus sp. FWC-SCC1]